MANLTLKFYPNTSKRGKNSKIPIYARVTMDRQKREIRLDKDFDIPQSDLNLWDEFTQRINRKNESLNDFLDSILLKVKEYKLKCKVQHKPQSLEEVVCIIKNEDIKDESVKVPLLSEYIEKFLKDNIETLSKKEGTKKNYRNALRQLKAYLIFKGIENIRISEFKYEYAQGFKKYLESDLEPSKKKGVFEKKKPNLEVSSSTKIKNVKPLFNKAIIEEYITKNPFKDVKLNFDSEKTPNLSVKEVKAIFECNIKKMQELEFTKDIFLFMCYTGLSITDALTLSSNELQPSIYGRYIIDTTRDKTRKQIKQIVIKPAEDIIKKYWDEKSSPYETRIFPNITDVDINRKLKTLSLLAGLRIPLITKIARTTCRELLKEAMIEDYLLIRCFMGWSNKSDIEMKYYSITEEKLLNMSLRLEIYLHDSFYNPKEKENDLILVANELKWN